MGAGCYYHIFYHVMMIIAAINTLQGKIHKQCTERNMKKSNNSSSNNNKLGSLEKFNGVDSSSYIFNCTFFIVWEKVFGDLKKGDRRMNTCNPQYI